MQVALNGLVPDELSALAAIELVDARRIVAAVHRDGALPARCPPKIRRAALDRVRALAHVPHLEVVERAASQVDPFVKLALRLGDGRIVEAVRIPLERAGRYSACVSSQVGCALACAFCATGRMGLGRNLETWEIVDQVRAIRADLGDPSSPSTGRVHGVVFQGMGEPLANVERVVGAIRVLGDPSALAIDQRNVTVCTAGLPAGIRRLAAEVPNVRLGISIGDARPDRRAALLPIDRTHPLDEVLAAAGEHAERTGLGPMWAVALLAGVNDDDEAARALAGRVTTFHARHGVWPRVRVIPFNEVPGAGFERSSDAATARFRDVLVEHGVGSVLRYSGGGDVGAACGQLAREGETRRGARRLPVENGARSGRPAGSSGAEGLP